MNLSEYKRLISERTGIPEALLTGETAEEDIATAKALLAYKQTAEAQRPRSTAQQFEGWFNAAEGIKETDPAAAALDDLKEQARIDAGGYPVTPDAGEVTHDNMPDARPAAQQFEEWFNRKTALKPSDIYKMFENW